MAHEFLSEEWFAAVEALGPPPASSGPDIGAVNLVVTRSDGSDIELHLADGAMSRGLAEGAPTTVTTEYDVAKALFVDADQQAAMQAFMAGKVKVQGDMAKLLAAQAAGAGPGGATALQAALYDVTE